MLQNLAEHLQAQQAPMKAALMELLRIPSACQEGAGGYPVRRGRRSGLAQGPRDRRGLGIQNPLCDGGYYGLAEIGEGNGAGGCPGPPGCGAARQARGLDVWALRSRSRLTACSYGRGAQDDKGPTVAALYAAKALMDAGVGFNKRLRFIFGTDEETLWRCINRYKEREELPGMGFSPDSRFPLTYAEKGLLQLHLEGRQRERAAHGGRERPSMPSPMPCSTTAIGRMIWPRHLTRLGFRYTRLVDGIEVHGKAAHAMVAEEGVNAIARTCIALEAIGARSKAIDFVAHEVAEDPYAERIFGACADEPSGRLKFNVGKIDLGEVERLSIDCRIPVTVPKEEIVAKLSAAAARYGLEYRQFDWLAPLYLPLDHFMIQTLMRVYRRCSGDSRRSRSPQEGPPTREPWTTAWRSARSCRVKPVTEHQPNERTVLANLYKAMEIYAVAIHELTG